MNQLPLPSSSPPSSEIELDVIVNEDGSICFVHDDDLKRILRPAFRFETFRASHCEPTSDGWWSVDVAPLRNRGQYVTAQEIIAYAGRRDDALAIEVAWLKKHLEGATA